MSEPSPEQGAAAPTPFDWSARYESGDTPWDLGGAHPELLRRLAADELAPCFALRDPPRALVPGCGRGHDAEALAAAGVRVTAVDFVDSLRDGVARRLERHGGVFLARDALTLSEQHFELLFEHTFYSALPPTAREHWGELARRVLVPGGRLVALVFPFDRPIELGGPPWATRTDDMASALGSAFELQVDVPVTLAGPGRRWQERWAVFERRADSSGTV